MARTPVAALIAALIALPAGAEERDLQATYDLYVGGLHAMEVSVDGDVEDTGYSIGATIRTTGFIQRLYSAEIVASTTGAVDVGRLVPSRFVSKTNGSSDDRRVEMTWPGGAPSVVAEPAFDPKPWEVDPAEQAGAFDPLTAVLTSLAPAPAAALCGRSVEVFDGRRRYGLELDAAAAERNAAGEIACSGTYRRIAGYSPRLMARAPDWPFRAYFAEGADGLWHLERVTTDLSLGAAVLLRRP